MSAEARQAALVSHLCRIALYSSTGYVAEAVNLIWGSA